MKILIWLESYVVNTHLSQQLVSYVLNTSLHESLLWASPIILIISFCKRILCWFNWPRILSNLILLPPVNIYVHIKYKLSCWLEMQFILTVFKVSLCAYEFKGIHSLIISQNYFNLNKIKKVCDSGTLIQILCFWTLYIISFLFKIPSCVYRD
jgi:hypothetical protein